MDIGIYHKIKHIADLALRKGRRDGSIIAQPCEVCHNPKVDGHHPNYLKPEEIVWLCRKHHGAAHKGVVQMLGDESIYRDDCRYIVTCCQAVLVGETIITM